MVYINIIQHQDYFMDSNFSPNNNKPSIQVIERLLSLLDVLAANTNPVSLKKLSSITGLHPSTAHRILNDLVSKRFAEKVEPGSYKLGIRLLELGNIVKSRINVREVSLPLMQLLHDKTQQAVNLTLRRNDEIVYIDRAFSEQSGIQVVRPLGGSAPLHLTSTGKLFLSTENSNSIKLYASRTKLKGNNKNSITDYKILDKELSNIKILGYARDNEELEIGVKCIGAGIKDDSGKIVAGLSISSPAERMNDLWLNDLINASESISNILGYKLK
tara:strand:- start:968 stop:1786 length:819 start_codon:yes stop_codon:yes gene_type:complete